MMHYFSTNQSLFRRDLLKVAGGAAVAAACVPAFAAPAEQKTFRIGVISAAINGKPQERNGHTWHFAQYLHPTVIAVILLAMEWGC